MECVLFLAQFKSRKQKLVSKSSMLIGLSDSVSQVIWSRDFLTYQGYKLDAATVFQDNKRAIAMASKGMSTSDRTRHINIRYLFIKDPIDNKEIKINYLPTEEMTSDILTKPLQGEPFRKLRSNLLNWSYWFNWGDVLDFGFSKSLLWVVLV